MGVGRLDKFSPTAVRLISFKSHSPQLTAKLIETSTGLKKKAVKTSAKLEYLSIRFSNHGLN